MGKLFLFALLLSSQCFAMLCDVTSIKTGTVVATYEGATCNQSQWGGDWGDSRKYTHARNVQKEADAQAAADAAKTASDQKAALRAARVARLKALNPDDVDSLPKAKAILKELYLEALRDD